MYALKALFTLLRLSSQILRFLAAVTSFGLTTIDLCDKSFRFICEDGDRVIHMKDAFWLAASYARSNQHQVNKNFSTNVNIFFGNRIQRMHNSVQQAESRNGQLR